MASLNAAFLGAGKDSVGLRETKNIEWVKITAVNSGPTDQVPYVYKEVKSVVGVLCCGPFQVTIDNSTKTVTIYPVVTVIEGTYYVGLLES